MLITTHMTHMTRTALAVLVAGSASAQPDMLITVDNVSGNNWQISAEYLPIPAGPLIVVWGDTSFDLTGDGSLISVTSYNPQYDTTLGDAVVTNGPTANFRGNANSFFGVTDPSNPLWVAEFEYAGSFEALELTLIGQNSLDFDLPPFGQIYLYQDADGNPGEFTWDVRYIPAPATLALAPIALAARRRRK